MPSHLSNTVFLASIAFAAAQLSGLSQQCQTTLEGLIVTPVASCVDLLDAYSVSQTPANTSLIPGVDKWLTNVCAATPCSNSTISSTVPTVLSGCSADLSQAGITASSSEVTADIEEYYPFVREAVCLKSNNAFCLTSTLTALQTALNETLDISTMSSFTSAYQAEAMLANMSTQLVCTDCIQSAYAIVKQAYPSVGGSSFESALSSKCGTNFISGGMASDVQVAASSPSATATGNAAHKLHFDSSGGLYALAVSFSVLAGSCIVLFA